MASARSERPISHRTRTNSPTEASTLRSAAACARARNGMRLTRCGSAFPRRRRSGRATSPSTPACSPAAATSTFPRRSRSAWPTTSRRRSPCWPTTSISSTATSPRSPIRRCVEQCSARRRAGLRLARRRRDLARRRVARDQGADPARRLFVQHQSDPAGRRAVERSRARSHHQPYFGRRELCAEQEQFHRLRRRLCAGEQRQRRWPGRYTARRTSRSTSPSSRRRSAGPTSSTRWPRPRRSPPSIDET